MLFGDDSNGLSHLVGRCQRPVDLCVPGLLREHACGGAARAGVRLGCRTRPPGAEECYTVEKDGTALRMLRNGSEAWYGTLKPVRTQR